MKYDPFDDRKALIKSALISAILWEESRIDAGVCEPMVNGDDGGLELQDTKGTIKAYKRYLKHIAPNRSLTLNESLDADLTAGKLKLVPVTELIKDQKFNSND